MFIYIPDGRFMVIGVYPKYFKETEILDDLEEIKSLVNTYGSKVFALAVQKAEHPSGATYIRKGKIEEAGNLIAKEKIDIVVARDSLKPGQLFTLEKAFYIANPKIQVWDRTFLILHIFDLHATSSEAKLQIKIASLKHMGARLYGMGYILSDQGGGIGMKGVGETNTEIMKRHWKNEIMFLKKKLNDLENKHRLQIDRRKREGMITASIIGYTNSGKSTLFNLLTGKNILVEDKLFVTLDSTTAKLFFKDKSDNIILTDTIGFIKNLPPFLIDTFKSTLMETVYSDVVILLIDASDKEIYNKLQTVENIAKELKLDFTKIIYVFNKIDKATPEKKTELLDRYRNLNPLFISAISGLGIEALKNKILEKLQN